MKYKVYNIIQGETLEVIAKKNKLSIEEMLDFHNQNSGMMQQFFAEPIPVHISEIRIPLEKKEEIIEKNLKDPDLIARYRCEQTVVMKLNGIIHSHADTKREFEVKKYLKDGIQYVSVKLVENIVEAYQKQLELAINLVSEIDKIKCDVTVSLNKDGKIAKIINFEEIQKRWKEKKIILEKDFSFMRDKKAQKDIQDFLDINDKQFSNQKNIINDLNTKLFFDVFFDKYLTSDNYLDNFSKTLHSQLFDGYGVQLDFIQNILAEDKDHVELRKVSTMDKSKIDNTFLNNQYEFKFKPIVKYQFSEYNFSVREHCTLNTTDRWIDKSDITIIEDVKNNVQVLIDYKLKKIE